MNEVVDDKSESPTGMKVIWREILRDKLALVSLIFIVLITLFVFGVSLFLEQSEIVKVDLFAIFEPPSSEFWLGTDYGGRDVFGQLIIGAKNSLSIGILVTLMSGFIGIVIGVVAGYFGGMVDNVLMRIVDFFMVLPFLMVVIVFVAIIPKYSVMSFSLSITLFLEIWITVLISIEPQV